MCIKENLNLCSKTNKCTRLYVSSHTINSYILMFQRK